MRILTGIGLAIATVVVAGCGESSPKAIAPAVAAIDGSRFLLASEPAGAMPVIAARKAAVDGEDVVLVGRIGGSEDPWIEGRAAFSIVDASLKACSDVPGDTCPKPWDYCCEIGKLPTSKALVKVVDANGKLIAEDARGLLSLKELQTVVVRGKAERDDAGNLTVLASGIFVRPNGVGSPAAGAGHDHKHDHDHKHEEGEKSPSKP